MVLMRSFFKDYRDKSPVASNNHQETNTLYIRMICAMWAAQPLVLSSNRHCPQ